jgi:phosphoribosylanthranilate isomerase
MNKININKKIIQVKFCGITNRQDFLRCCDLKVDFVGFNFFAKSPRFITLTDLNEVLKGFENFSFKPKLVAVLVDSELDFVKQILNLKVFSALQFHGDEKLDFIKKVCQLKFSTSLSQEPPPSPPRGEFTSVSAGREPPPSPPRGEFTSVSAGAEFATTSINGEFTTIFPRGEFATVSPKKELNPEIWKVFSSLELDLPQKLNSYQKYCDKFVLDLPKRKDFSSGVGVFSEFQKFKDLKQKYNLVLAGGVNPENVSMILKESGAELIDVASGIEESLGIKSLTKMKNLLKIVEDVEKNQELGI